MLKIIVVDDDKQVGLCLQKLIPWKELDMCLAGIASDGEEGFQLALDVTPDIIISDLVMPGMDGAEFMSRIIDVMPEVSFIFLSAYEDFATAKLAMKYRVADYILKPIDRGILDDLIELLKRLRAQREAERFTQRLLHDRAVEADMVSAIREGKTDDLSDIFLRLAEDSARQPREPSFMRNVCHRLITLYFEAVAPSPENEALRAEIEDKLNGLHFAMDMLLLTSDLYFHSVDARDSTGPGYGYYETLCRQVKDYIAAHFSEPSLSLAVIADAFHYSPDYLGRMFQQHMDVTLHAFITECRVTKALRMLEETSDPISSIAASVGYVNAGQLTRLIRRQTGMTPHMYRSRYIRAGRMRTS